jgi:RNA polymerase sigma factor (sigma-70 family)
LNVVAEQIPLATAIRIRHTVLRFSVVSIPNPSESPSVADPARLPALSMSKWFTDEVHPHDSSLRAYLRGSFPAVRDVDDVVQESYLKIWNARPRRPIACARAFLFRIARNVALNLLHRERISPIDAVKDFAALPVVQDQRSAATEACVQEELLLLARAIDSLPSRCREIVILRRIKNIPQKEIAARLGIAEETVEVQVARGVKRCGEFLRRQGVALRP